MSDRDLDLNDSAVALFPVDEYVVPNPDQDWAGYWRWRWPCKLCGGTPLPDPDPIYRGDARYPRGADPCLGWLPGVRFACGGHGHDGYVVRVEDGREVALYGEDALEWFRSVGVGPPAT